MSYTFDEVGNVLSRSSTSHRSSSTHSYEYDGLYQLISAEGEYQSHPAGLSSGVRWQRSYTQEYTYDGFFNMSRKVSSERRRPTAEEVGEFNYELDYIYDASKPHQAARIGDKYFGYDDNGNLITESRQPPEVKGGYEAPERIGEVRVADRAWGMGEDSSEDSHLKELDWS